MLLDIRWQVEVCMQPGCKPVGNSQVSLIQGDKRAVDFASEDSELQFQLWRCPVLKLLTMSVSYVIQQAKSVLMA